MVSLYPYTQGLHSRARYVSCLSIARESSLTVKFTVSSGFVPLKLPAQAQQLRENPEAWQFGWVLSFAVGDHGTLQDALRPQVSVIHVSDLPPSFPDIP